MKSLHSPTDHELGPTDHDARYGRGEPNDPNLSPTDCRYFAQAPKDQKPFLDRPISTPDSFGC